MGEPQSLQSIPQLTDFEKTQLLKEVYGFFANSTSQALLLDLVYFTHQVLRGTVPMPISTRTDFIRKIRKGKPDLYAIVKRFFCLGYGKCVSCGHHDSYHNKGPEGEMYAERHGACCPYDYVNGLYVRVDCAKNCQKFVAAPLP